MKKIVTMQDVSCYGKCSLTIALPVLSVLGQETTVLPTAVLSTHTGFSGAALHDLTDYIPEVLSHWKSQDIAFDAAYTGYLADTAQLSLAKDLFDNFLPDGALRFVDPVLGDHGKLYRGFDGAFVTEMRTLCAHADFLFPNITELFLLTDTPCVSYEYKDIKEQIDPLMKKLSGIGPRCIVLTGAEETDADGITRIGARVYDRETDTFLNVLSDKQPRMFPGTGDLFCSVFIGSYLRGMDIHNSAQKASDFVSASIAATLQQEEKDPAAAPIRSVYFEPVLPTLFSFE